MEDEKGKKDRLKDEKGYIDVKFEARDFKKGHKLVYEDKEYDLHDKDLHIEFDGDIRQLVAVFDAHGYLKQCPVCEAECPEDAMVILTDYHILYPCWVCNQLIERKADDRHMNREDLR